MPSPACARRRASARRRAYGRKLGLAVFATLSGALAFSLLTDGGRQTRAATSFLPERDAGARPGPACASSRCRLSGQRFTPDADVFEAIDLPNAGSLLTFDATATRARIEALPWVATATISRVFPGALDVAHHRAPAVALWLHDGREYLDRCPGRVLSALKPGTRVRLPRVAGEGADREAQALLDLVVALSRASLSASRWPSASAGAAGRCT